MKPTAEAWLSHHRIVLYLLDHLTEAQLDGAFPPGSWTVRRHLAHLHDLRIRWLAETEPLRCQDVVRFEDDAESPPTTPVLRAALVESGALLAGAFDRLEGEGRPFTGFPGAPASFLAYLVAHETNHLGQVEKLLELAGAGLGREVGMGLWRGWWDLEFRAGLDPGPGPRSSSV